MQAVFSIIMPVYDVEEYLEDAILSILNQSFERFELIIINDGSSDNSAHIAFEFAQQDNRIKIYNQKNSGLSSARNAGVEYAVGDYLYFMDSDDTINLNMLEKIYNIFSANHIDMVAFTAIPFWDKNYKERTPESLQSSLEYYQRKFLSEGILSATEYYENTTSHKNFVASACMYVVKRKIIKQHNLIFFEDIIHEDELFTRQLLFCCKNIYFMKEPFYNRRIRINSISTSTASLNKIASYLIISSELEILNKRIQNAFIKHDIRLFFDWAVGYLKSIDRRTKEYNRNLRLLLNSPLAKKYPISFNKALHLRFKKLEVVVVFFANLRYKLAIIKRRINSFYSLFKFNKH